MNQKFCNILVVGGSLCIVVSSIVVVGAMALLCKASIYVRFENRSNEHSGTSALRVRNRPYNAEKAIKNICYTQGEGSVDHSTVIRWLKFRLGCKNRDNQAKSDRLKPVDSEAVL